MVLAALQQNRTAAGIALALDSAQMLMTPEVAAELAELRARDAALLTVMERVRSMASSVTDADGVPTAPGCSVWGLLSDLATVRGLNRAPEHNQWSGEPYPADADDATFAEGDSYARFVLPPAPGSSVDDVRPQVRKLRSLLAGQRAAVEDPHEGPLAHRYLVGRDLPETGGAPC